MKGRSNIRQYCVIGYPIAHSLSPKIHNRAFRKLKIPARYRAISVPPGRLSEFMSVFRDNFAGANVTIPHKENVMKFLDEVSPEARVIGAVNTIVNRGGRLVGYNTDVFGAMEALRRCGIDRLKNKRVIVLGAGGAARAVVYGLRKAGAKVIILNRTLSRARKLAGEFGCDYGRLQDFGQIFADSDRKQSQAAIIINTTSLGMWPHVKETPIVGQKGFLSASTASRKQIWSFVPRAGNTLLALASPGKRPEPVFAMDIIYRPRLTRFLRDARRAGRKIITGDKMFLAQAAASFKLWTDREFSLKPV